MHCLSMLSCLFLLLFKLACPLHDNLLPLHSDVNIIFPIPTVLSITHYYFLLLPWILWRKSCQQPSLSSAVSCEFCFVMVLYMVVIVRQTVLFTQRTMCTRTVHAFSKIMCEKLVKYNHANTSMYDQCTRVPMLTLSWRWVKVCLSVLCSHYIIWLKMSLSIAS